MKKSSFVVIVVVVVVVDRTTNNSGRMKMMEQIMICVHSLMAFLSLCMIINITMYDGHLVFFRVFRFGFMFSLVLFSVCLINNIRFDSRSS